MHYRHRVQELRQRLQFMQGPVSGEDLRQSYDKLRDIADLNLKIAELFLTIQSEQAAVLNQVAVSAKAYGPPN